MQSTSMSRAAAILIMLLLGACSKKDDTSHVDWMYDQPEAAITKAREEGRPLLVDFYGTWCPPCMRMDREVFSRPEIAAFSANFVNLKLDADKKSSWSLKEKYHVGGYPTFVFASSEGEEIARVVGYLPPDEFLETMRSSYETGNPIGGLMRKLDENPGDAALSYQVGKRYMDAGDRAKALGYFERALAGFESARDERLWNIYDLKRTLAAEQEDYSQAIAWAEQAMKIFPRHRESAWMYLDLAGYHSKLGHDGEAEEALREGLAATLEMLEASEADRTGYVPYLKVALPDFYEKLGDEAGAREALSAGIQYFEDRMAKASTLEKMKHFLPSLRHLYVKAGEKEKAEKLLKDCIAAFPDDFRFPLDYAALLHSEKRLDEARAQARAAFDKSYGDNRLRVVARMADIMKDQGKGDQAAVLLTTTIESTELPADEYNRTHRYVRELQKRLQELK